MYECQRVEYTFTYPVRTECVMFVMCYMQWCNTMLIKEIDRS